MSTKLSISETQKQALVDFVEKLLESSDDAETLREEFSELLSSQFKFKKASTKEKIKKDPSKPKRGKSGYRFFCSVTRDQTKLDNPDMGGKEIMTELGRLWSESSEEEKKPFLEQAKSDKDRYESEMVDYHPSDDDKSVSNSEKIKPKAKKEKVKKDPTKPKRGKSGYIFFCSVTRDQIKLDNPDMGGKDIMTELGRLWSESSEEEKKPFLEQAKSDKDRYESEMVDYHPSDDDKSVSKPEKIKPKAKKEKVKKEPAKPKKDMTGYVSFCYENRQTYEDENPEASFSQLSKILGDAWKACDDKEDYKERAKAHFEENKALPMDGNWEE